MPQSPKVGEKLEKKLSKQYAPSERIDEIFMRYDLTFLTNETGDPVVLFIGQRQPDGTIKGDRFARRLLRDATGKITKSHWDYKGRIG